MTNIIHEFTGDEIIVELNKIYPVLPLRNTVLFPNQIIPIYIGRKQSLQLISDVNELEDKTIIVVAQKDGNKENPKPKDLYKAYRLDVESLQEDILAFYQKHQSIISKNQSQSYS